MAVVGVTGPLPLELPPAPPELPPPPPLVPPPPPLMPPVPPTAGHMLQVSGHHSFCSRARMPGQLIVVHWGARSAQLRYGPLPSIRRPTPAYGQLRKQPSETRREGHVSRGL